MTTIYVKTVDQVLTGVILPKLATGNQKTVRLHVEFDTAWSGYTGRSAIFFTSKNLTPYKKPLSSDGNCDVPPECLVEEAHLFVAVEGVNASGAVKSSTRMQFKIVPGSPVVVLSDPTADVYHQLLGLYGNTETALAVERARINNILSGAAAGDTEVTDMRIDVDGKTHATAGEAVRNQIGELRNGTEKTNLIDTKTLIGGYLSDTGTMSTTQYTTSFYRWEVTTDYIAINPALPYMLSFEYDRAVDGWYALCTYDAEKNFISRMYTNYHETITYAKKFTFSDDVAYVRISYRTHMTAKIKFEQSAYATRMQEEKWADNLLENRPLVYSGYIVDNGSIFPQTEDGYVDGHPALLEKYTGFIPITPGEEYTLYHVADYEPWYAVCFYTSEGVGQSRIRPANASDNKFEFTVPAGAFAMALSCRTYYLRDFALFRKNQQMCDGQKIRENYLNLSESYSELAAVNAQIAYNHVKSIAHRGYSTDAPENTLAAFRLAKEKGFKFVECDVSFTADDVAVLLHDGTIDRTSNGTGNIADLTLDEVRALDFGGWKSAEYAGEKIPTFAEFIALCKYAGLHPYIELKSGTAEQITGLVSTVKRYGMRNNVTWISFDASSLAAVAATDKTARLGYVVDAVSQSTIDTANTLKSGNNEVFIDCSHGNATEEAVQLCMNADFPLEVWTVNSASAMLALDEYITGVTSDYLLASDVFATY